ncbi:MAG: DUF3276 family protein [Bacteroidota bacterium]
MPAEREPLFEKHLRAGGRRYQLEVHLADNGHRYLMIEDIHPRRDGEEGTYTDRIYVFDEHIERFINAINQAAEHIPPAENDDADRPEPVMYTREEFLDSEDTAPETAVATDLDPDLKSNIEHAYYEGKSVAAIARQLQLAEPEVEMVLRESGAI